MKKFIISIFALIGVFFITSSVDASNQFNNHPNDLPTVMVANHTQNPCGGGAGAGCWATSVSANPGDTVSVMVYYHNTSGQIAYDVALGINPKNSGSSTNHTFRGGILVYGYTDALGSASVSVSQATTLNFIPGSVRWFPNRTTSGQGVSNETSIFDNYGFSIGNIGPDDSTQGSIVAQFRVGSIAVPNNCSIDSFTADNYSINQGASTILRWATVGCDSVSISPTPGSVSLTGSKTVAPYSTTTYTLNAYKSGVLTDTRNVTVNVVASVPNNCSIDSFTADNYSINQGASTILRWATSGCDSVSISPTPGSVSLTGSQTVAPYASTTYTLSAYKSGILTDTRNVRISVTNTDNNNSCYINSFYADNYSINEGDSTRLRWTTVGCDTAKISPDLGNVSLSDSRTVSPNNDTTYTLSVYNNGYIIDTATVRIYVKQDNNNNNCSIDSFRADDYSITKGDSVKITWSTTGARDVDISPDYNNRSDDGDITVRPSYTTTYRLNIECDNGSNKSNSLTISVDEQTKSRPQVVTTVAAVLSATSAQLNGIAIPNTTSETTRAWFEWGPSGSLGYTTNSQTVPSNTSSNYYNTSVTGLVPGTVYYYRAVVQNNNGTAYGDLVRFQTRTAVTPSPTPTPPTTTIVRTQTVQNNSVVAQSAPSLLELRVDSAYDRMCVNGTIDYTITYSNTSTKTLQNAVLQVNHQKEVTFISSSRGNYDVVDRTITVDLGQLAPGETGTVLIHGRVNNEGIRGNLTVMTAQVVYTNSQTRAQESAIAYSLITVSEDCPNVLGASAAGLGGFLPNTLIEWLFLILIILAFVVLSRQLTKKKEPQHLII